MVPATIKVAHHKNTFTFRVYHIPTKLREKISDQSDSTFHLLHRNTERQTDWRC